MVTIFTPAFTTNAMTLKFLLLITLVECDLLDVVLAFLISILKIFKSLQNYWHRVTDIKSFGKRYESSLGHTLNFCPNLVKYRSKNMYLKESPPVFYGDLVYKPRRVKSDSNFISSGSKIVKRLRSRQYDPEIIERTIGIVLGPFTALYRTFLKRCTLTNKAVGTIWRALSKPPQRRQGPVPRPLWLLVGTPSAFGPELAYRLRVAHPTLMDVPIFLIYFYVTIYVCVPHFYDLSVLVGCWSSVSIRRIIYTCLNVCPFDYTAVVR